MRLCCARACGAFWGDERPEGHSGLLGCYGELQKRTSNELCRVAGQSNMEQPVLQMEVVGVRVEMPTNQPIVLLKEAHGERFLPIWIGMTEATAIALAQAEEPPPRPLTHDLF